MSDNFYELIALAARYLFAGLMLLIVIRAWRITIIDSRRAAKLRRWAPETGVIGEMQVLDGDEKARRGMVYPVIREGMIGRSRKSDIRLRSHSVRLRHAYFEMASDGLHLRSAGSARISGVNGRAKSLILSDGGIVRVGKVRLMLVLTDASVAPEGAESTASEAEIDSLFQAETPVQGVPSAGPDAPDSDVFGDKADDILYGENNAQEEEWWPRG
ncbi:MAG: FHA domain-containing protein [Eubacteriales bacterium]|nr:FHA domain-containing protein [Eubacteriales bacterium]